MPAQNYDQSTPITVALITILTLTLEKSHRRCFLDLVYAGAGTVLDQFVVQGLVNADGAFQTLKSASADYTSPAGIIVDASGDLTTLASGASGWLLVDVQGLHQIRFQAARATGSDTTMVARGNLV